MTTLTIRKIGNSEGMILPKEILARLHVKEGDRVFLTESPDGYFMHKYDPEFAEDMKIAKEVMCRYKNALKRLADS